MAGGAFEIVEHAGARPGPTVALLGGVHGDEDEGVLAAQRVGVFLCEHPLQRGIVRAVPVAHPAAYAANRRTSPLDGLNLARCFPGDATGEPTERLAHELTEHVIRGSDLLVDLHSAGRDYAMPTFAGYVESDDDVGRRSRRAAAVFGAPLVWAHPAPVAPGRTISTAVELGIPSIYVEGSGGGSLERDELELLVDGVLGVLAELGMTASRREPRPRPGRLVRGGGGDLDAGLAAPCGGRFVAGRRPGEAVTAGDSVGEIVDDRGDTVADLVAPADATVMFLRRTARIAAGEVVCALGAPAIPWSET
jgi:predicted deacylase